MRCAEIAPVGQAAHISGPPSLQSPGATAERERLAALEALQILDTPAEERFDRIARLAARLLGTPVALVSLVASDRQWFKACIGLDFRETPRTMSFCAHALGGTQALVVPDARADARFADNPLVTGPPHIRFYAGHPIRAAGGEPLGTLCVIDSEPRELRPDDAGVLRDLAALVELELASGEVSRALVARREGEERLRAILDTSDEGVIALDASGRIERLNATACRLLRLPDDEPWLGRQLSELVGGDLRGSGEAELRRPDGTTFPARHRSAAVAAGGGQVVTFRDLTERRALRQMRERFLRVAGHELRTPLTNILGYAEELTEDLADRDPDLRSGADAVLRNARRLQQLTDDMLLLMRLEAGHVPLQPDALDLAELVTRIATGDERVQVAGEAAPAHGDRRLLGRAVRALVRVGLAESGTGGIVLRSSAAGGGAATLALEVPGSRLRPADAERLLEPFGRAETSGAQEGTGLELALAAGVAEVHGGRLAVEAAGSGLVIVLELPRPLSRAG